MFGWMIRRLLRPFGATGQELVIVPDRRYGTGQGSNVRYGTGQGSNVRAGTGRGTNVVTGRGRGPN